MRARFVVLVGLLATRPAWAAPSGPGDADRDGLSDFDEVHKYRTDPSKADSDGDGLGDGESEERREFTYSIRLVVAHLPPADAVTDLWQDARVLRRDAESVELEITTYPFADPGPDELTTRPAARENVLEEFLRPNLTCDFDPAMQKDLRAALKSDGIEVGPDPTPEEVRTIAAWAMKRVRMDATGFTIPYVTAREGFLAVEPGLEKAFLDAKSDTARDFDAQLDVEVRGRGMFRGKTCGSCTSAGVYLQTIFRALNVPARTTVAMPAADGNDPAQIERLRAALRPSALSDTIVMGAASAKAWTEHTFNEVFAGGRWRRLNYASLDEPLVVKGYQGMLLRILTYDDRATSGTAATWGRKWGLRLKTERFPTSNPYRLIAASDLLGPYANVPLALAKPLRTHERLTITDARWDREHASEGQILLLLGCEEWFDDQDADQYKRFTEVADTRFTLEAEGAERVELHVVVGSFRVEWGRGAMAVLDTSDLERLAGAKDYRLVPRNGKDRFAWEVKPGVVVRRP